MILDSEWSGGIETTTLLVEVLNRMSHPLVTEHFAMEIGHENMRWIIYKLLIFLGYLKWRQGMALESTMLQWHLGLENMVVYMDVPFEYQNEPVIVGFGLFYRKQWAHYGQSEIDSVHDGAKKLGTLRDHSYKRCVVRNICYFHFAWNDDPQ